MTQDDIDEGRAVATRLGLSIVDDDFEEMAAVIAKAVQESRERGYVEGFNAAEKLGHCVTKNAQRDARSEAISDARMVVLGHAEQANVEVSKALLAASKEIRNLHSKDQS